MNMNSSRALRIEKILKLKRKATVLVRLAAAGKSSSSVAVCGCVDKAIVAAKAKQGGEPL